MKCKKMPKIGKSGRTLLKILCTCILTAEYGLLCLLHAGVISAPLFFLQAHAFRESCYISAVLVLGGVLLADIEEKRSES